MATYGHIQTSRNKEPGHPGSDPEVQRRQLADAGVDPAQIYSDVAASGTKRVSSRNQWHLLDQQLAQGDVLVVAAIDRIGRAPESSSIPPHLSYLIQPGPSSGKAQHTLQVWGSVEANQSLFQRSNAK